MKRIFIQTILILLFINYFESYSQSIDVTGIVLDKDLNKPIPFAHIYSLNKFGTTCNEKGLFRVRLDSNITGDSVVFSSIGYHDKKLSLVEFLSEDKLVINLIKKDYLLNEVQITPLKETIVLGPEFSKEKCRMSFLSSIPFQTGILIDVPFHAKIESAQFYIKKGKYSKSAFRVRIYRYDTISNKPSTELTKRVVMGELEKRQGWATVSLESENIYVSKEKIVVAFETVFIGDNFYHQMKILGEERQLYGATLVNCIYNRNNTYYKTFLKNYKTNEWNEFIFNPSNIDLSFPMVNIELKK
jgi:hypothetical protein